MIALIEAQRAGLFAKKHLLNNVVAGVIVGVVALPLAMAFAIASGAKPEQGIYTAIVAGFLTSVFGGTRLQVSGPTGAFIVILSGITAKYGISGLQIASLMAGVMLCAIGFARLGSVIKFIPDPVIIGFTAGIGLIIWVGQWRDFFGLAVVGGGEHFHEKLGHLLLALPTAHLATTGLALLCLALLILGPRLLKKIPAPLVVLVVATVLQSVFSFAGVATIGSAFGGIPQGLPAFQPLDISFSTIVGLIGPAFTIALLGAIESLLSAVVADGMAGTRHDSNQELIGQGIANIFSPLFGGFAATGAIARTATNIRNGATSPLAGITHSIFLVATVLLLAPLAANIPLCALAAILFVVAYNMSDVHHMLRLLRTAPRADVILLLITFVLTVFADLVIAVNVGVVLASLLFMRRMAQSVQVLDETAAGPGNGLAYAAGSGFGDAAGERPLVLPPRTLVYRIDGPFFFGAAEKFEHTLENIQSPTKQVTQVVLRLGQVPFIDATGLQTLGEIAANFHKKGIRLVLCEVRPNVLEKLKRADIVAAVGADNVFATLADFVASETPVALSVGDGAQAAPPAAG
ncbi:MAG: sulfate permease [Rugosibacter sp.]|jgi:SulP family sulfate permease|nr:sulfate permease, SulP family [Rugosibacter sp.]